MAYLFKGDFVTDSFDFHSDPEKCIHCGLCVDVCSSHILYEDEADKTIKMHPEADGICGWAGCYRCQRCLAVCPSGAITIQGKDPADSVLPREAAGPSELAALMRMRRSCRSFKDQEVPRQEIDNMLTLLENVPTGSNRQNLKFHVTYDKSFTHRLGEMIHSRAFELAEEGIYPGSFGPEEWKRQSSLDKTRNHGEMFLLNAPHILIISSLKDVGCWHIDPHLAAAWFDLICASRDMACIIMSMPVGALSKMPEVESLLEIPEDRHYDTIIAFGYPKVKFARGVQREGVMETKEIKL